MSTVANSNYNGLTASLRHQFHSLQVQANYTWSHALDEVSNAGFLHYTFNTNTSVLSPQDPFNLRGNYGNADYDVAALLQLQLRVGHPALLGSASGLRLTGRSPEPSSPAAACPSPWSIPMQLPSWRRTTSAACSTTRVLSCSPTTLAERPRRAVGSAVNTPCLTTAMFSPATSGLGVQRRNQFYGPKFFDTDFTVMKNFRIPHWESGKLGVGLQFFNLFNHPEF